LPDSLESLNPMFERHWRVIGERLEDADIWGAACHTCQMEGALCLEAASRCRARASTYDAVAIAASEPSGS
jgi:hypothetical protein